MARPLLAVAVLAAATLAACSGDGDRGLQTVTVHAVADATTSAGTARMRIDLEDAGELGGFTGEGVTDFRTGNTSLRIEQGGDTFESLVVGGRAYIRAGGIWLRAPLPEDAREAATSVEVPVFAARDLVDELRTAATGVTEAGTLTVRGAKTTSHRLHFDSGSEVLALLVIPPDRRATATMAVDDDGRLRRLVVEPDEAVDDESAEPWPFPVPRRAVLELWDFGVEVDLEEPDPDDVVDFDDPRAADALRGGDDAPFVDGLDDMKPTGPFALIASGRWEHVAWEVWEASTGDGRVCQTFEPDPPPDHDYVVPPGLEEDFPVHNGVWAECRPHADLFQESDPILVFHDNVVGGDYWYIAGVAAPEITTVQLVLTNGRVVDVAVDERSHVFTRFSRQRFGVKGLRAEAEGGARVRCRIDQGGDVPVVLCSGGRGRR